MKTQNFISSVLHQNWKTQVFFFVVVVADEHNDKNAEMVEKLYRVNIHSTKTNNI